MKSNYIDLLKKTLSFSLWPEPSLPIETFNYKRRPHQKIIINLTTSILRKFDLQLTKVNKFTKEERENGMIWPGYADTMIGLKRLENLQICIEKVILEGVEGDFIETGVWRGGACIFMRAMLAELAIKDRKVYVADSFEGLPEPEPEKYPEDKGDTLHTHDILSVSMEEVQNNFKRYGLLDDQVIFLKGWFEDTLPNAPMKDLAIMRLDGDMYSSTMDALVNLYPKLTTGGYCIIDDYALKGCKQAVDQFRRENDIKSKIENVDWSGVYWRK
jgi:O-methyltransferase